MKFGRVEQPEIVDFTLPEDQAGTTRILNSSGIKQKLDLYVGCAKWNRQELRNFYPRGVRNDLNYYSEKFNAIELNATFYRIFPREQFEKWSEMVGDDFRFFPKIVQQVSHLRRLNDMAYPALDAFLEATTGFGAKLGTIFLQLHPNFGPKNWDRVVRFIEYWPAELDLAVEFRHKDWYTDRAVSRELYVLMENHRVANIITDTAGRRDLLHMRLTSDEAFIRFVGANHKVDYSRLDQWAVRLKSWREAGLSRIHFFVHQNTERESPFLASYFLQKLRGQLHIQGPD